MTPARGRNQPAYKELMLVCLGSNRHGRWYGCDFCADLFSDIQECFASRTRVRKSRANRHVQHFIRPNLERTHLLIPTALSSFMLDDSQYSYGHSLHVIYYHYNLTNNATSWFLMLVSIRLQILCNYRHAIKRDNNDHKVVMGQSWVVALKVDS